VSLVLAVWAKVWIHRDAHVQILHCLYSVPYKLVSRLDEGVDREHETPGTRCSNSTT